MIERGMEQVEELLADTFHIDIHLAHTWLLANHEDCIHSEVCQDAFFPDQCRADEGSELLSVQ